MEIGQVWTFSSAPLEESRLTIRRIDEMADLTVFHVSIAPIPVKARPDGAVVGGVMGHMPFTRQSLSESRVSVTGEDLETSDVFNEGYDQWVEAKGGVFSISPAQAIEYMYEVTGAVHEIDPKEPD